MSAANPHSCRKMTSGKAENPGVRRNANVIPNGWGWKRNPDPKIRQWDLPHGILVHLMCDRGNLEIHATNGWSRVDREGAPGFLESGG